MTARPPPNSGFRLGFNYIPPERGCGFWRNWRPDEIKRDLAAMAASGVEVVRFFVFWADLETEPGRLCEQRVQRLETFVDLAARHGLLCLPSLLTLWMNGQVFDLSWRGGRDLFRDSYMLDRAVSFVGTVAHRLKSRDNIFAYDLADEILAAPVGDPSATDESHAYRWYRVLKDAIHAGSPGVPVIQANQGAALWSGSPFSKAARATMDVGAVHGFPSWTPFAMESTLSYSAKLFPGFLIRLARAYWPSVILDEFGCYGVSEAVRAAYVASAGLSAVANGAEALFPWCWRDVADTGKPYDRRPAERFVGFHAIDGTPKPAMAAVCRVVDMARQLAPRSRALAPDVGILLPDDAERDGAGGYLSLPAPSASALFFAYLLAKRAHLNVGFTADVCENFKLLIVPCRRRLTGALEADLTRHVRSGGTLLYTPGSYMEGTCSPDLFGVSLVDFTTLPETLAGFVLNGHMLPVYGHRVPTATSRLPVVEATGGEVLARFADGSPALVHKRHGTGQCFYLNAPYEELLDLPGSLAGHRWCEPYCHAAAAAGVVRPPCPVPEAVEALPLVARDEPRGVQWLLINHTSTPVHLPCGSNGQGVAIDAADFRAVSARFLETMANGS